MSSSKKSERRADKNKHKASSHSYANEEINSGEKCNEQRHNKIIRYWTKKLNRSIHKKVRYDCRQDLANKRFRYQGRFIKREELCKLDPIEVCDPSQRSV